MLWHPFLARLQTFLMDLISKWTQKKFPSLTTKVLSNWNYIANNLYLHLPPKCPENSKKSLISVQVTKLFLVRPWQLFSFFYQSQDLSHITSHARRTRWTPMRIQKFQVHMNHGVPVFCKQVNSPYEKVKSSSVDGHNPNQSENTSSHASKVVN